jgi:hypothetical protein
MITGTVRLGADGPDAGAATRLDGSELACLTILLALRGALTVVFENEERELSEGQLPRVAPP